MSKRKIVRAIKESQEIGTSVRVTEPVRNMREVLEAICGAWDGNFETSKFDNLTVVWGDGWLIEVEVKNEKG